MGYLIIFPTLPLSPIQSHHKCPLFPWLHSMQPRQRFIAALERRPLTGRVPHFELVFFSTMEAFGKVHLH
jgi:hypothetical protein